MPRKAIRYPRREMEIGLAHRWANKTLSSREMEKKGGIEIPERTSAIPAWAWIVGAVLVIVSIFAGYRAVQTQQHLAATQSELENAKQAAEKANAERNELETKLDGATSEVRSAQSVLAETQSVLEAAQSELERATQEAEKGSAQRAENSEQIGRSCIGDQISPITSCGDPISPGSSAKRT